jgi:RHH-type proline utilization regulon transcriptional repressor/proline dehydrogenase/delta 1-pyrroline-5-carboxylate dehydrogenase
MAALPDYNFIGGQCISNPAGVTSRELPMNRLPDVATLLSGFRPDLQAPYDESVQKAVFLARRLQERAVLLQTPSERRQQSELDRMLHYPSDKATLAQMTDQAFRAADPGRAAGHLIHILDVQGIPRCFSPWDRALLKGFQTFGGYAPGIAMPLVKEHMRKETANVILPGEKEILTHHLRQRNHEGLRMNVNFLGEAILSEQDAQRRLEQYLLALQWPEIEVVSIKISTLYSQISPLARRHTVAVLCDRLEQLFRTAARATFVRHDGAVVPKFVYLDMEEYRDKELTAEAFMRTLDREGLQQVRAGIALQSYIPDSFRTLLDIQQWALRRAAAGGGRITVRLVKGANMESERCEASLRGWPQAPYKTKRETDANFRRMLLETMKPQNLAAMDVGVASHNLFELAYALVLAVERQALDKVQFEMLEGMANHQRRALREVCPNVLLYAPACCKENFLNAIGYLIRRLDENTGPENFLRHAFKLHVGSPEWQQLESGFLAAFDAIDGLSDAPRRTQDRRKAWDRLPTCQLRWGDSCTVAPGWQYNCHPNTGSSRLEACPTWQNFVNEPDTDFSLPQNDEWAADIIAKWKPLCDADAPQIPLVVAGEEVFDGRTCRDCRDPSRPGVAVGLPPGRRGQRDVRRRVCGRRSGRLADHARARAVDRAGWRGPGDPRGPRRPDGSHVGQCRQDALGVRSRGLRGRRFSGVLPRHGPLVAGNALVAGPATRRRGRGIALEFPDRHSLRRRGRGAGGGQHGHSQAGLRRRARGLGTVPVLLARGRVEEGLAVPPVCGRRGGTHAGRPRQGRCRDPHGRDRNRAQYAAGQARHAAVRRDGR